MRRNTVFVSVLGGPEVAQYHNTTAKEAFKRFLKGKTRKKARIVRGAVSMWATVNGVTFMVMRDDVPFAFKVKLPAFVGKVKG